MNNTTTVEATQLASITTLFIPIVFIIFLIALISNLTLLGLIFKATKVNNNTNVYLFSMGIVGLLGCFSVFTLITTLAARRWVLGKSLCFINDFLFRITIPATPLIHAIISRDRYKAVIHPTIYWKTKVRNAVMISAVIWMVSFILSFVGTVSNAVTIYEQQTFLGPECFDGLKSHDSSIELMDFIPEVTLDIIYAGLILASLVITLIHYALVLKELHLLDKLRFQHRMLSDSKILKVNGKDKPIRCSTQERTTKSLVKLFFFQFICFTVCSILILVHVIHELVEGGKEEEEDSTKEELVHVAFFVIYLLPTINPLLLILFNKRYRNRVKGLLKCELSPEDERSSCQSGIENPPLPNADRALSRPPGKNIFISNTTRYDAADNLLFVPMATPRASSSQSARSIKLDFEDIYSNSGCEASLSTPSSFYLQVPQLPGQPMEENSATEIVSLICKEN